MILKACCRSGSVGFYCQNVATRLFATQVEAAKLESTPNSIQAKNYAEARPFSSIPGPSATSLLLSNLPGGRSYKADLRDVIKMYREEYGDILKFPSIFGKPALIVTHNPDHFQTIFRTEGVWPERLALESMQYFRQNVRPDLFGVWSGLINTQGKQWGEFRTAVNPVMIQPKNIKVYIPTIDEVASDFLNRIRKLRDPTSNRLPDHFEDELNKWALESIGVIAMDTRLGLISDKQDENATKFIESVKTFFALTFDLEFRLSIWRIVKTPKFRKLMGVLDTMTNLSSQYIDEAKARLEQRPVDDLGDHEKSVLEKLLKIDPVIAKVMAMDMVFAGVDTVDQNITGISTEYNNAAAYSNIPGPSTFAFIRANLPGGKAYKADLGNFIAVFRKQYGNLFKIAGVFGKPDMVFSHDPDHFQTVFRTEGIWPARALLEAMEYFRKNVRPDIYGTHAGLLNSQGKEWGDFRTAVNPIMIQPKIIKQYIPTIDTVASDFLSRVRLLRDPTTNQLPDNFEDELNKWSLESIGVVAMDKRLGLISDTYDEGAAKFIQSVKRFFELSFELEFRPSLWRIVQTPKFRQLMSALNTLTDLSSQYIDEAKARLEQRSKDSRDDHEKSVLEKLLKIDPVIAKVMAMDMVFAGVDTTSATFSGLLYLLAKNPEKQELLRQEILTVLPEKSSSFTVEKMARLPYLRACIKEGQRMIPTVAGNIRAAGQDLILDGYQIPKGTQVLMISSALTTDETHFPAAHEFIPERWLKAELENGACPAAMKKAHPFTFLPFGFGPRMCIGRRLAEMELEILTSKIVRNFYVSWEHPDLKFVWKALHVPDGKLAFTLNDVVN